MTKPKSDISLKELQASVDALVGKESGIVVTQEAFDSVFKWFDEVHKICNGTSAYLKKEKPN